ncbi:MAG: GNAT family N-acetyltransferase [Chloroflexi bacterium]|nr:GNAT family N-acetyltransferase [Chloroflexota bacterium]
MTGNSVTIRTTTRDDFADLMTLWNDGRVMQWVGFPNGFGYDVEKIGKWFEKLQSQPHRHHFVVYADGVGFCGEVYYVVEQKYRRAELDIKFVPAAQGQGLAADALQTLIRHVFEIEKEVDVVWTEPRQDNSASRKLYTRCGLTAQPRPSDLEPFESYWALSRENWRALLQS